jgi:hypothetical protein
MWIYSKLLEVQESLPMGLKWSHILLLYFTIIYVYMPIKVI